MTALSQVHPVSNFITLNPPKPLSSWSAVKVQRVWQTALAYLGLIVGAVSGVWAISRSLAFLIPATAAALFSGRLFWSLSQLIDFDNPEELKVIRGKAANMPLGDILATYGWGKLFRYAILSPEAFQEAFQRSVEGLNWNDLLARCEEAEKNLEETLRGCPHDIQLPFHPPSPSKWKERFLIETKTLSLGDILANYKLSPLIQHKILDEGSIQVLKKGEEAKILFEKRQKEAEAKFVQKTEPQREVFDLKEQWIQQKYDRAPLEEELQAIHRSYLHNVETENKIAQIQQQAERSLVDHLKKSLSPLPTPDEKGRLIASETTCERHISLIREALKIKKNGLYQEYLQAKKRVEAKIASLQKLQEAELATARLSYCAAIKPQKDQRDQTIADFKKELDDTLSDLNREYDEVRIR